MISTARELCLWSWPTAGILTGVIWWNIVPIQGSLTQRPQLQTSGLCVFVPL